MTDPITEGYLEEAAAELRKARAANEQRREMAVIALRGDPALAAKILAEVNDRTLEIADGFIRLAAIKAGLPPCCHHAQPEPEPQQ